MQTGAVVMDRRIAAVVAVVVVCGMYLDLGVTVLHDQSDGDTQTFER